MEHIIQSLIGRDAELKEDNMELHGSDKLFNVSEQHVSYVFRKINCEEKSS